MGRRLSCAFVGALFVWAAVAKAWSMVLFVNVVRHLIGDIAGEPAVVVLALMVVGLEALVGVLLLTKLPSARVLQSAIAAVLLFTAALVVLAVDPAAPACGCFGASRVVAARWDAAVGIVRNCALLGLLVWVYRQTPVQPTFDRRTALGRLWRSALVEASAARRGFTLVELLMVIGVLGLLAALTLPALSGARARASDAKSLALQSQSLGALSMYAADSGDSFPYFQTPGDPAGPKLIRGFDVPRGYFWAGRGFWANLIVPEYFEPAQALDVAPDRRTEWNLENDYPSEVFATRMFLTDTAFARPRYWASDNEPWDNSMLRSTRQSDVLFPSAKGLTVDILVGVLAPSSTRTSVSDGASVGRADGSAGLHPWSGFSQANVVQRSHGALAWPVFSTRDGLAGRDF